ncbi:hypothetical protein AnigIFM60653_001173 [Aspergillus niger]|nr:hypothetical protein AnigIFM60653_001173 [Aspergillus niger]
MSSTLTLAAGRDLSSIGLSAWPGRPPSPRVIQSSLHRVDGDTHGPPSGTWPATDHASYTRRPNLRLLSSCGHGGLEQPCWPALWRFRGPANGQPADKASSEQLSTLISQNGELAAGSRRQSRGKPEAEDEALHPLPQLCLSARHASSELGQITRWPELSDPAAAVHDDAVVGSQPRPGASY